MSPEVRSAGLLLLASAAALLVVFQLPSGIFFDLGPNDGRYVSGFREDFEVDEPTIIHWTTTRSSIRLPFYVRGPYELTLRFKRHIASPAEVRLFLSGEAAGTFTVPQQDFAVRTFRRTGEDVAPLEIELLSSSRDPRELGLALDWLEVRPERGMGALWPTARAMAWLLSWVLVFYAFPHLLGLGRRLALVLGGAALVGLVATSATHKLWAVHVATTLGIRAHVVMLALGLFYLWRRRAPDSVFADSQARWAVLVVGLAFAARLFALFHPDFYYPDVRTHSKFVSVIWTEGLQSFFQDYIENQHRHLLGLQYVSGRWLAFPYPPLLYLSIYPLSLLELPVEDWMKLVPAALAAVEGLLVFALARKLNVSPRAALFAVALHASARVIGFRLAVASFAAMFGHFWDMVAVLYLTVVIDRIERPIYGAGLAVLVAVSLLSYAGSGLVLGMFMPLLAIALASNRGSETGWPASLAVAGWSLLGAVVALASFYGQYVPELLGAESPGGTSGEALRELVKPRITPVSAIGMALHRLELFYWLPFCLLFAAGLLVARRARELDPLARPLAIACLGTYLGLNFLRAGLGETHIFQFSKDDLVILPLLVIVIGMLLERLAARGRLPRLLAGALVALWVGWGAWLFAEDVRSRFIRPGYEPGARVALVSELHVA